MALSDYLNDDEWDACFYASMGLHRADNFGASMHKTIDHLLANGYEFSGLDLGGNKREQVPSSNAFKVCMWFGNPHNVDVLAILENGRKFLKVHSPDLVDETDEEWAEQITAAKEDQPHAH